MMIVVDILGDDEDVKILDDVSEEEKLAHARKVEAWKREILERDSQTQVVPVTVPS
jgi:hypothetical protein